MPATSERELVTIVTPCLNAARFLEQTIQSVLSQDYPRIEYIVMDGGSSDGTIEILKKYEHSLHWESAPDRGTADAVNRGFARGKGEILAFLNADDVYHPDAVSTAVQALREHPEASAVYGEAWWIDEDGARIAPYPVRDFDRALLEKECFICQPACFFRREPFEIVGGLDPDLNLSFDYDFWLRLTRTFSMVRTDATLADSRMHRANKTLSQRDKVFRETFKVLKRDCGYVPFQWIYSYLCFRGDARDQFFEPFRPSIPRYLQSLPVGLWMNPGAGGRYIAEWAKVITWQAARRRLS
ncbi:MAG TPA: glycosyltransferase family 2 protein [Bryobacteraceae bacterium]|jgi:glycosyltransferase involved in cell wall biosynthesis|nr:glycosyltransferase family 2 protein [Bryobacteraceae bacterium]